MMPSMMKTLVMIWILTKNLMVIHDANDGLREEYSRSSTIIGAECFRHGSVLGW